MALCTSVNEIAHRGVGDRYMLSKQEIFSRRLALIAVFVVPIIYGWEDLQKGGDVKGLVAGYIILLMIVGVSAGVVLYFGAKGIFWALSNRE